jgi:hypothetical protein
MIQFKTNMNLEKSFIAVIAVTSACVAASSLDAARIPAGATITVKTLSRIASQDVVGRSFEAKIVEDVSVNGNVVLRAGAKAFGKIHSSRANPRRSEPLSVDLTGVSVNGRNVAIKTNSVQPEGIQTTARQRRYGHTAGTLVVNPGTKFQFQLVRAVSL